MEHGEYRIPERNLLLAILNRAVLDYLGNQAVERNAAKDWLFDEDAAEESFSYYWVCQHLGINADYLREGIEDLKQSSKGSAVKRWYLVRGKREDSLAA